MGGDRATACGVGARAGESGCWAEEDKTGIRATFYSPEVTPRIKGSREPGREARDLQPPSFKEGTGKAVTAMMGNGRSKRLERRSVCGRTSEGRDSKGSTCSRTWGPLSRWQQRRINGMSPEPESRSGWESMKADCEGHGAPRQRVRGRRRADNTGFVTVGKQMNPETNEGKDSKDGNVEDRTLPQASMGTEESRDTSTRLDDDGKSKEGELREERQTPLLLSSS